MASPSFLDLTAMQMLRELAGPVAPAGGSALAFTVAMAAAVVHMAAGVSKESWDEAAGIAAQANALGARVAPLAQLDADVLDRALAVRDGAAEPPLEIARVAVDVAELALAVATSGEPRVRADAVVAATLAAAAARAAVTIVAANLTALEGDPRIAEAEDLARAAEHAAARARSTAAA
jgi:formiminotetrahydrofolate cyclodeaminase